MTNKFLSLILISLIKGYRLVLSPLVGWQCRFQPTCSVYALEAVERFGPWKGSYLAAKRLLSCHPFGRSGYDPVPDWRKAPSSASCKHTH